MQTLATSALQFFKDKCFNQIHDHLRNALLNQITRDRNNEKVDWDLLKACILAFVQMGFITADIVKQDDDYVWKGEKNLHIYEKNFEEFLISKVSFIFFNYSLSLKKSTLRKLRDGFATSTVQNILERQKVTLSKKKREPTTSCKQRPSLSF